MVTSWIAGSFILSNTPWRPIAANVNNGGMMNKKCRKLSYMFGLTIMTNANGKKNHK